MRFLRRKDLEVPNFSPAIVRKADILSETPISKMWATKGRYETESTIDSDVLVNPGSRNPWL